MIAQWIVEGRAYGQTELTEEFSRRHLFPSSYGFFCPRCARVWATVRVDAHPYYAMTIPCERCPPYTVGDVPGTLSATWNHTFNESMPDALVEREYLLHLALFVKETDHVKAPGDTREAAVEVSHA